MVFPWTETIEHLAGCKLERPSKRVFLVSARRHDLVLRALRHPRCADLRQEVDVEFIRLDHHFTGLQMFMMIPQASQTLDPVRVVIFGHQLGACPPQPISCSQRRTVSAETAMLC